MLKEISRALMEADVNVLLVKKLRDNIKLVLFRITNLLISFLIFYNK